MSDQRRHFSGGGAGHPAHARPELRSLRVPVGPLRRSDEPARDLGRRPEDRRRVHAVPQHLLLDATTRTGTRATRTTMYLYRQDITAWTTTDDVRVERPRHARDHGRRRHGLPVQRRGVPGLDRLALRSARRSPAMVTASSSRAGTRTTAPPPTPTASYYKYYAAMSFVGSLYTYAVRGQQQRRGEEHPVEHLRRLATRPSDPR